MRTRMRSLSTLVLAGVAAVLLAALAYGIGQSARTPSSMQDLGAQSAPSSSPSAGFESGSIDKQAYDSAQDEIRAAENGESPGSGAAVLADTDRLIVRNAAIELRVRQIDTAIEGLRAAAKQAEAEISDLSVVTGEPPMDSLSSEGVSRGPATAYVTLRVPADELEALELMVAKLGTVLTQTSSSSDVTEQAVDLEARLKNLRAEESRLRAFLNRAGKISELLEVERELSRVRGEIESMDARLTYLERQAARSTLTVTLSEPGSVVQPIGDGWGLREAVTRGIQVTVAIFTGLITIAIPLVAAGLLVAILFVPMRAIHRRRSARRTTSEDDAEPEELS